MHVDLEPQDIETLIHALACSRLRALDAKDAPYAAKLETLRGIDIVELKLRKAMGAEPAESLHTR